MSRKPKAPEAPKDQRCCGTCRHWKRAAESGEEAVNGECRRYPPTVFVDEEGTMSLWPYTATDDTCGEHAPVLQ